MERSRAGRTALLDLNLPQLQNLIRRDPPSYRDDFIRQWRHFASCMDLVKMDPSTPVKQFDELVSFLAHVCDW
jgi:protein SDA1